MLGDSAARGERIESSGTDPDSTPDGSMSGISHEIGPRAHENPDEEPEAPETPPDEPEPAPVQDPPAEPIEVPYVVRDGGAREKTRTTARTEDE